MIIPFSTDNLFAKVRGLIPLGITFIPMFFYLSVVYVIDKELFEPFAEVASLFTLTFALEE